MSFSQTTIVKVRELPLLADIGINPDEIGRRQPLVITVEAMLDSVDIDQISQTVDYRRLVSEAEALASEHIPLIETFAQRLAERCMAWSHVISVRVAIDKPFAITRGTAGVDVTLARRQLETHDGL
jgi:dihydroneopterin aldolase